MKLLLAVTLLAMGCGSKKTDSKASAKPTSNAPTLKACDPPAGPACNFVNCGGNSAVINAFPVHGIRPDGECNRDQIQLVPSSMDGGKCKGMTLDIDHKKLVGRDGANTCGDQDLKGASFEVRSHKSSERIEITDVIDYTAPNGEQFHAYRMEWTKETDHDPSGKRKQLCAKEGQKLRKALGVEPMKFSDDIPDAEELVIPIVSELYDETGKAVPVDPNWAVQKPEWNHLACVADALAKRTMFSLQTDNIARSRAALRMWTADYCGGRPFTMRGEMIDWGNDPNLEIEAQWSEDGASCLIRPRIVMDHGQPHVPANPTILLKKFCPNCQTVEAWTKEAKHCTTGNSTSTTDQVLPDCQPCTTSSCPLESRHVK